MVTPAARITRLHARNYRSIEALTLDLDRTATVLVGPNGAGKSNIIDALAFIADSVSLGLDAAIGYRDGIDVIRRVVHAARDEVVHVTLEVELRFSVQARRNTFIPHTCRYGFSLGVCNGGAWHVESEWISDDGEIIFERQRNHGIIVGHQQPDLDDQRLALPLLSGLFTGISDTLRKFSRFDIAPSALRAPQPFSQSERLTSDGTNLNHVWSSLESHRPEIAERITALLGQVTPEIGKVSSQALGRFRTLQVEFGTGVSSALTVDSAGLSDGTLRALALLVAVHHPAAASLIAVEEPEKALHPHAAELLFDALLSAKSAPPLLISTHSPSILSSRRLDPARMIRVVEWRDGRTLAGPIAPDLLKDVADRLTTAPELLTEGSLTLDERQTQHQSLRPLR